MARLNDIREEAKKFFKNTKGSHDWAHTERVYVLCMRIGRREKADLEILRLAVLLHDIGREEETRLKGKICHAKKSAELARKVLKDHGFDKDKIEKIIHCIETHRFRGQKRPRTREARVLFDADKLDSIGAVGVGRAFLFAGEIGAKLYNRRVDVLKTKGYTKEDTAYREFMVKLKHVKSRMLTKTGRRLAQERHQFMVNFFKRLDREVKGIL
jgi:uncharacterized protein